MASPRGRSRGPAVAAAYLVKHGGLTLQAAFLCLTRARPATHINAGFFEALQRLEMRLLGTSSVTLRDYRRMQPRIWDGVGASSSDEDA